VVTAHHAALEAVVDFIGCTSCHAEKRNGRGVGLKNDSRTIEEKQHMIEKMRVNEYLFVRDGKEFG